LEKRYGRRAVVGSLDMRVEQGEIYALVGSNGAGKTTVLRMIAGLARPSAGQVVLFGGASEPWGKLGLCIGACGVVGSMTVLQNLMAKALALGVVGAAEHCAGLLGRIGLTDEAGSRACDVLSGQRALLGIALALVGSPDLLLLDEPLAGLDSRERHLASALLEEASQDSGTTMVCAMRSPGIADFRISRYGIMNQGRMLKEMTSEQLEKACIGGMRVRTPHPERTIVLLGERLPEANVRMQPDGLLVVKDCDEVALATLLHESDQPVLELSPLRSDVDSILAGLLGGGDVYV
jgi:ABC-2 type transport system ATP-binding protein